MGINRQQALDCFASDDLIGIGMEADAVRRQLHPEGIVSYAIGCSVDLSSSRETIADAVAAMIALDGTDVRVECHEPHAEAAQVSETLRAIKDRHPRITLSGLTAGDVLALAASSSLTVTGVLGRLRDAGLDALAEDEAASLAKASSDPSTSTAIADEDWVEVHRAAHALGIPTMASMTIGGGESREQRVHRLEVLRNIQAKTGGFCSFTLGSTRPPLSTQVSGEPTSVEYLTTLAICRMFLDNIEHVGSASISQGTKVLQMGLRFGADDAGLLRSQGTEEEIRRLVRDAGFKPAQRDLLYTRLYLG